MTFGSHTAPVMCVKWGGENLIYSASRDKTIKVWDAKDVSIFITIKISIIALKLFLFKYNNNLL